MKKQILIIDDEANFSEMLKINLEKTGNYDVDKALGAEEGYEKIKQKNYHAIFLDILMPKVEGHEALQKIKSMCKTPVLIMSAYVRPRMKSAILDAGAAACLEKPIELKRLIEILEKVTPGEQAG